MLVYDVTDRNSFENLKVWFSKIEIYANKDVVKFLVGNKQDNSLDRTVSVDEAKVFSVSFLKSDNNSRNLQQNRDVLTLK
jgi:GTPase SAR1 family protein